MSKQEKLSSCLWLTEDTLIFSLDLGVSTLLYQKYLKVSKNTSWDQSSVWEQCFLLQITVSFLFLLEINIFLKLLYNF